MTTITTHEAKLHLSHYLAEVEKCKEFVIASGNAGAFEDRKDKAKAESGGHQKGGVSFFGVCTAFRRGTQGVGTVVKYLLDACVFLWVSQ